MKKVLFAFAGAFFCAAGASFSPPAAKAEIFCGTDYSRPGYGYTSLSAEEILIKSDFDLSEGEREYLSAHTEYDLKYTENIPGSYIGADYYGGLLTVDARECSYAAVNGKTVTWTPLSIDGEPFGGHWSGEAGEDDYVSIVYKTALEYPATELNILLNAYYNAVNDASAKLDEENKKYSAAKKEYDEQYLKYSEYLKASEKYADDLKKYNLYLEEYAAWQKLYAPYSDYLEELKKYEEEKKAYDEYDAEAALAKYNAEMAEYYRYLEEKEEYDKNYQAYLAALQSPEHGLIEEQLNILAYAYLPCRKRTLRNAITGNAVTEVLSRKSELKLAGADGDAVDRADRATRNIRDLLMHYEAQESRQARYSYYITSYSSLRDNYTDLLRCLDYFYRNRKIKAYINSQNKTEQYRILLAQLYETVRALNEGKAGNYEKTYKWNSPDAADFDEGYKIDGLTPAEILGENCLLERPSTTEPLENGYTELPQEPKKPDEVTLPVYPESPRRPLPPQEVADPGLPPEEVLMPSEPVPVEQPSEPQKYEPSVEESALAAAAGKVSRREERASGITVQAETTVKKYFRGDFKRITVYFFESAEASEPYFSAVSEGGGNIELPERTPEMYYEGHTCVFKRWVYKNGVPVDFSNLSNGAEEVNVYPEFEMTPNLYDVYWMADGEVLLTEKVKYGETPHYAGTPAKPAAGGRRYRFSGWDKEPFPMPAAEVRYYAQFESTCLITWHIGADAVVTDEWRGDVPKPPPVPLLQTDKTHVRVFGGWEEEITAVSGDAEYNAALSIQYIAPFGTDGGIVEEESGSYSADCTRAANDAPDVSLLFALAAQNGKGVTLILRSCSLNFTSSEAAELHAFGISAFSVNITRLRQYEYRYRVDILRGGDIAEYGGTFKLTVTGSFKSSVSKLVGLGKETRFEGTDLSLSFVMRPGEDYEIYPCYKVTPLSAEGVEVSADKLSARRGERVKIIIGSVEEGRELQNLYVYDVYGNAVAVSDTEFIMPASDVTIGVSSSLKRFEVIFRSEGKIISRISVAYGEIPLPPADPVKAPDGEFSYSFAGWDGEFTPVTCDTEYNAMFTATPLPEIPAAGMSKILKILIGCAAAAAVIFVAVIVFIVLAIVKKRRKKQKNSNL